MALRRIKRELKDFESDPPDGVYGGPTGDNLFEWNAIIVGPPNTPYKDGKFSLEIVFPVDYPFKPPHVKFQTKIYHCNINDKGGISMEILGDNWSPALTISKVLRCIRLLLKDPISDHALMNNIAKLYKTNRLEHDRIANEWTRKYADGSFGGKYYTHIRYNAVKECLNQIFGGIAQFIAEIVVEFEGSMDEDLPMTAKRQREIDRKEKEFRLRMDEMQTHIIIKTLTGKRHAIKCCIEDTVENLKREIEYQMDIRPQQQRIIFAGKQLEDDKTLRFYNIDYDSTVFLVLRLA